MNGHDSQSGPGGSTFHVDAVVLDALVEDPLLCHEDDGWRWRFHFSGVHLGPAVRSASVKTPTTEAIEAQLKRLGGEKLNLGVVTSELGILPSSPSWTFVQSALERLRQAPPKPATARTDEARFGEATDPMVLDSEAVERFESRLTRYRSTLDLALRLGAMLGRYFRSKDPQESLLWGLRHLSEKLTLRRRSVSDTRAVLQHLTTEWLQLRQVTVGDTEKAIEAIRGLAVDGADAEAAKSRAWKRWSPSAVWDAAPKPHPDDLIASARGEGPLQYLRYDLRSLSIREWSVALQSPDRNYLKPLAERWLGLEDPPRSDHEPEQKRARRPRAIYCATMNLPSIDWPPETEIGCVMVDTNTPDVVKGLVREYRPSYLFYEVDPSEQNTFPGLKAKFELYNFSMLYGYATVAERFCKFFGFESSRRWLAAWMAKRDRTPKCRYVLASAPPPEARFYSPYIVAPASLADAVEKTRRSERAAAILS